MDLIFKENNIIYNVLCFLITENEKLFDSSDSNLYWRTVFHVFLVLHHATVATFTLELKKKLDLFASVPEVAVIRNYKFAYLTGWNFAFQTIFLGLALTHDVLEWTSRNFSSFGLKIKYLRDVVFCSMVVPYTVFVTSMFWILYWIDRELVFPEVLDEIAPWWFNHCIHTNISIVLVLETLLQARRYPTNHKLELTLNATIAIGYAVVYYAIFFLTGHWLYKVFGVLTWWQVCIYQLLIWGSNLAAYYLQFPINRAIHGADYTGINDKVTNNIPETNGIITYGGAIKSLETADVVKNKDEAKQNGVIKENGKINSNEDAKSEESTHKNEVSVTSLKGGDPMDLFATKSWSLKYRSIRNQFEKNSL